MKNKQVVEQCEIVGCDTPNNKVTNRHSRVLCQRHYAQVVQFGEIINIKHPSSRIDKNTTICYFCGVKNKKFIRFRDGNIYCEKHYDQLNANTPLKIISRKDKNEIRIFNDTAKIVLYDKDGNEISEAIIDIDDVDKVKVFRWRLHCGYPCTTHKGKLIFLHNLIMDKYDENVIDHTDRNKLDNRKINLRIASLSENGKNRSVHRNNKSGVIGVYFQNHNEKWVALIQIKEISKIKRFDNFKDAVYQRLLWEKLYCGEFAPQRHLFKEYGIE